MNILVTGAHGLVGRMLVQQLSKIAKVRCLVRKRINDEVSAVEYCLGDIRNKEETDRCVKGADVIVHSAALIHGSEKDIMETNVMGTKNLIDAAIKWKVKKFVYLSTENVLYDYCDDPYTQSKREAEKIVSAFPGNIIFRPSIIYGRGDTRYLGYLASYIKKHYIVPVIGNGKNLIQPVHVHDVIKCVVNAIKKNLNGIYTLCGADPVTYNEVIDCIKGELGVRRLVVHVPIQIMKPLIYVYEKIARNPKLRMKSLAYLKYDRTHNVQQEYARLNHHPMTVKEGVHEMLGSFIK